MLIIDALFILWGKKNMMIHLRVLSQSLQDKKEYVKLNAYKFRRTQVTFLGHVVTTEGLLVDLQEAEVIRKWKQPITVTTVCDFIGLIGYYKHFIDRFSKLALSLTS